MAAASAASHPFVCLNEQKGREKKEKDENEGKRWMVKNPGKEYFIFDQHFWYFCLRPLAKDQGIT